MMGAMLATVWAYRRTWSESLVLLPLVLWPPVLTSLGQFTAIWMLGLALAWRWRGRPFVSGAAIAMASLTKFLPAVAMIPFVQKRNWYALAGFLGVWIIAVVLLLQVDPSAWHQYFSANQTTSPQQAGRSDNGALMSYFLRQRGTTFRILGILALSPLFISALVRAFRAPHLDQQTWEIWTWLSVSLLPIAWVYSLLPLLPAIVRGVRSPTKVARTLAGLALFIPFLGATPGEPPGSRGTHRSTCGCLNLVQSHPTRSVRSDSERFAGLGTQLSRVERRPEDMRAG